MSNPDPIAASGRAGSSGVIHDIGYRRYTGERLGRSYIRRSLFTSSLRGAFGLGRSARSKVLPFLLGAAMILPAVVIVAVINATKADEQPIPYARYAVAFQLIVAIFVASQAPQMVSRDLRFRTITLYFARPLERIDYVTAKFAAMSGAIFIITGVPLVVLYVGGLLAELPFGSETGDFVRGMLGLVVLSLLLAGLGLLFAAVTPRRGFAVAIVIVILLVSYGAVSTLAAVAYDEGNRDFAGWVGLFSPITLFDGVQVRLFGAETSAIEPPPGSLGGIVFCAVALAVIAGSYLLLLTRYRRLAAA
jgi:ABC-2 type transport system permease protein